MEWSITIDRLGRLVIPKDVRNRFRLTGGTRLTLREENERLVLVPRYEESVTAEINGIIVFRGRLAGDPPDHRQLREERVKRLTGR